MSIYDIIYVVNKSEAYYEFYKEEDIDEKGTYTLRSWLEICGIRSQLEKTNKEYFDYMKDDQHLIVNIYEIKRKKLFTFIIEYEIILLVHRKDLFRDLNNT